MLCCVVKLSAQSFTEIPMPLLRPNLEGATQSDVAFADVNNDGKVDVLITGTKAPPSFTTFTKLYINNGSGYFSEVPDTPFPTVFSSSVAFADVDGQNGPDVLIMGRIGFSTSITKLYINDGTGQFTELEDTPFPEVAGGDIAFADVDNQNGPDVLITGADENSDDFIAKLYINNGMGQFSEVENTPFAGVLNSATTFADYDGDLDQDVLIAGLDNDGTRITNLYINNGMGQFTKVPDTPFAGVEDGDVAFAKINDDDYLDILITGTSGASRFLTKLYTTNESGEFSEASSTPFPALNRSEIAFADVNNDTHPDVLLTGSNEASEPIARLFINDGTGKFSDIPTPFPGVEDGSIDFFDIDNDNTLDLFITGLDKDENEVAKFYSNDGEGVFMEEAGSLRGVFRSTVTLFDFNNDGFDDLLLTGATDIAGFGRTILYQNDGRGGFFEVEEPFFGGGNAAVAIADVDGINGLDVLIAGEAGPLTYRTTLFRNNGNGGFSADQVSDLVKVHRSAVAFADVDNQNGLDMLITGRTNFMDGSTNFQNVTKLYKNNGAGVFIEDNSVQFTGVADGAVAFAYVNNDTYPDVLITGENQNSNPIAELYLNNGSGGFTEVSVSFPGVKNSSVAFADVSNLFGPDVLIMGEDANANPFTQLYYNVGNGNFVESGIILPSLKNGAVAFGDINFDNLVDIILTGEDANSNRSTYLLLHNGTGYDHILNTPFPGFTEGDVAFGYVSRPYALDLVFAGMTDDNVLPLTKYYRNDYADNCGTPHDISHLFGHGQNMPRVSALYNNELSTGTLTLPVGDDCSYLTPTKPVYFYFTGNGKKYNIRTRDCNSSNYLDDTRMVVFKDGICGNPPTIECNDDENASNNLLNSKIQLSTSPGREYFMAIGGKSGQQGEFCIEVSQHVSTTSGQRYDVPLIEYLQGSSDSIDQLKGATASQQQAKGSLAQTTINTTNSQKPIIYPNPTTDRIFIKNVEVQRVDVLNSMGQIVRSVLPTDNSVDLSGLASGLYLLRMETENGVESAKVVIK